MKTYASSSAFTLNQACSDGELGLLLQFWIKPVYKALVSVSPLLTAFPCSAAGLWKVTTDTTPNPPQSQKVISVPVSFS